MTREEALDILNGYKLWIAKDCELREALDMAIEALQADTISREDTVTLNSPISIQAEMVAVVRCKDCKFKRLYDEGETKYYYCALEDRPNRNWSVDDTDYCSWAEESEVEE